MGGDRLQFQRFELKYRIEHETASAVRDFIRCYLEPDEYAAAHAEYGYPVHSLYLDSEELLLYHSTINGDRNRLKMRVRYYGDDQTAPVFLELKRRNDNCISKQRARVHRDAVARILAGEWPTAEHLMAPDPKQLAAAHSFCTQMYELRATPRSHVAYNREAWMAPGDNSIRVTLDRDIRCEPQFNVSLETRMCRPTTVFSDLVVLELKFTNRIPNWFLDLVRAFSLVQRSAAKYAEGVLTMGEERVTRRGARSQVYGIGPARTRVGINPHPATSRL